MQVSLDTLSSYGVKLAFFVIWSVSVPARLLNFFVSILEHGADSKSPWRCCICEYIKTMGILIRTKLNWSLNWLLVVMHGPVLKAFLSFCCATLLLYWLWWSNCEFWQFPLYEHGLVVVVSWRGRGKLFCNNCYLICHNKMNEKAICD